ncbi:MAG: (2Fe-2S)-binding protein [Saprospiraceae bacterium]|nr:(2Fe-2S)-binding protein [Saprospiraceae bacterium]
MNNFFNKKKLPSSSKIINERDLDSAKKRPNKTQKVSLYIDGERVEAFQGMSVLTCLFAHEKKIISKGTNNQITGAYCGMGICFCCTVFVDGVKKRACKTLVENGAEVITKASRNDLIAKSNINN